jgi:hypothetical protein
VQFYLKPLIATPSVVVFQILLTVLCLLPGKAFSQQYVNPLDAKLARYVVKMNTKLPAMVTSVMRQEKTTVFNGVLTYPYTITNKTGVQLAPMNISAIQRTAILPPMCADPDTRRMLSRGVSFKFLYYGNDGVMAGQVVVLPGDCSGR